MKRLGGLLKDSKSQNFRPDLYLGAKTSYSLAEDGDSNRSSLSVETDLAYDRLVNYLDWMADKNLVTNDS
ncbi:winged helix-turn-helix domain-containing protein [Thermoplasmatales archaeon AK]|nr:winged helix-turn-helix domain-containing protein [Thermoplasmatales archaeon AK]